jgi:adenylate kinase
MVRILLVGPPGAGKGTQATGIATAFGIPAISTGDIFRANVRDETPLGVEAKGYMDRGEYVPDSLTNALVADRLGQGDCARGFLLDGYPRTLDQVRALDEVLADQGNKLDIVIEITVDPEVIIERIRLRGIEQGRSDDNEDVVRNRLEVYTRETAPLIDVYQKRGILATVDGLGTVEDVSERILKEMSNRGFSPA